MGDQISIINDIASYEKELKQFQRGEVSHMLNLVHFIRERYRLNVEAGKAMAYSLQLLSEDLVRKEIEGFDKRGDLNEEEWKFIDACILAATGSLFTSVVISRYGGEESRLTEPIS